jgi:hypothetical protein
MSARPRRAPVPDPTVLDIGTEVAALLTQSEQRHRAYQQATRDGVPLAAITALIDADASRRRANALDPEHLASAWRVHADQWPDDQLLTFYRQELDRLTQVLALPPPDSA